jgi:hypothetical protein
MMDKLSHKWRKLKTYTGTVYVCANCDCVREFVGGIGYFYNGKEKVPSCCISSSTRVAELERANTDLSKLMAAVSAYKVAEQAYQSANVSSVALYDKAAEKAFKNKSKALRDLYLAHTEIEEKK